MKDLRTWGQGLRTEGLDWTGLEGLGLEGRAGSAAAGGQPSLARSGDLIRGGLGEPFFLSKGVSHIGPGGFFGSLVAFLNHVGVK